MEEYNDWIDKIFPKDILYADGIHDDTIPLNILGNGGMIYHKKRKEYSLFLSHQRRGII